MCIKVLSEVPEKGCDDSVEFQGLDMIILVLGRSHALVEQL